MLNIFQILLLKWFFPAHLGNLILQYLGYFLILPQSLLLPSVLYLFLFVLLWNLGNKVFLLLEGYLLNRLLFIKVIILDFKVNFIPFLLYLLFDVLIEFIGIIEIAIGEFFFDLMIGFID